MKNETIVQKDDTDKMKPVVNSVDSKETGNEMPEKVAEKKHKKPSKKSSAMLAASEEGSAVSAVEPHSSRDVRGSSGLANTGTIISYD